MILEFTKTRPFIKIVNTRKQKLTPCPSQPYSVCIENTTDKTVEGFSIFGADVKLFQSANWQKNGDFKKDGIIVSSGIPNVSYQKTLAQIFRQPIKVGLMYLNSQNPIQIAIKIKLNCQDANGNALVKTFQPTFDPYQQQHNVIAIKRDFNIDGGVSLALDILPKTKLNILFYPKEISGNYAVINQQGIILVTKK